MIKKLSIKDNDIKQSYLQAFFAKKIFFLPKLVLDCLFSEKFLTLTIKKKKHNNDAVLKKNIYMNRFINFLATCKLFLQKNIFSSKTSFGLLIFRKIFNVNYRKEKAQQ